MWDSNEHAMVNNNNCDTNIGGRIEEMNETLNKVTKRQYDALITCFNICNPDSEAAVKVLTEMLDAFYEYVVNGGRLDG